jgi:type I restriction enzyme S subunit
VKKDWPMVKLGMILHRSHAPIAVRADGHYPNFGIYSFGRGLFKKAPISGALTSASTLYRARAGQFVYSRLFAFEGAYGFVSLEFDGYYVSNEFPLFDCAVDLAVPEFIAAYIRRPRVWKRIAESAIGVGHRRQRVQPDDLLAYEIPLPPLAEQRRVVARIEEVACLSLEARTLRQQAIEEAEGLLVSMAHRGDLSDAARESAGWRRMPLSECIRLVDSSHRVAHAQRYPNLGIYSFAKGLFHKPPIDGGATSATTLREVRAGQFIYSRLFAFEGAYAAVTDEYDGHFVSNEYPIFECDPRLIRIEFLMAYFKASSVWKEVAVGSKGLGHRRQRVQPSQVLRHSLWVSPLAWQDWLAETQAQVDALKRLQAETATAFDALLPAVLDRAF